MERERKSADDFRIWQRRRFFCEGLVEYMPDFIQLGPASRIRIADRLRIIIAAVKKHRLQVATSEDKRTEFETIQTTNRVFSISHWQRKGLMNAAQAGPDACPTRVVFRPQRLEPDSDLDCAGSRTCFPSVCAVRTSCNLRTATRFPS